MTVIGFSEEEIRQVLEVAALVLKLGNVELINVLWCHGSQVSMDVAWGSASLLSSHGRGTQLERYRALPVRSPGRQSTMGSILDARTGPSVCVVVPGL